MPRPVSSGTLQEAPPPRPVLDIHLMQPVQVPRHTAPLHPDPPTTSHTPNTTPTRVGPTHIYNLPTSIRVLRSTSSSAPPPTPPQMVHRGASKRHRFTGGTLVAAVRSVKATLRLGLCCLGLTSTPRWRGEIGPSWPVRSSSLWAAAAQVWLQQRVAIMVKMLPPGVWPWAELPDSHTHQ